jgi:hypothetical protein
LFNRQVDLSQKAISKRHRQLNFLKRRGLFGTNLNGAELKPIDNKKDFEDSFAFLYEIFLKENYIQPNNFGLRIRLWDCMPTTLHTIAKSNGEIVGMQSEFLETSFLPLPSHKIYPTELNALSRGGYRIGEIANEAIREDFRKCSISTEMIRLAVAYAEILNISAYVVAVSPNHARAYEHMSWEILGEIRNYSDDKDFEDYTILVGFDIKGYKEFDSVPKPENAPYNTWKHYLYRDNPFMQDIRKYIEAFSKFAINNTNFIYNLLTKIEPINKDQFKYFFNKSLAELDNLLDIKR